MTDSWICRECGLSLSATDEDTLVWGIESHRCVPDLREVLDRGHGWVDGRVLMWLCDLHGRPFALFRAHDRVVVEVVSSG